MILFLMEWLKSFAGIRLPLAFQYYSTRMMLAAMTSLLITIFLGPWFIRKVYFIKNESSVRTQDCAVIAELHQKKKSTPTMGGALILMSMLVSMFLWMDLQSVFTLMLFLTTVVLGALGARDDYLKMRHKNIKGISGKKKLLIQMSVGLFLGLYLLVPSLSEAIHFGSWYMPPVVKDASVSVPLEDFYGRIYVPFLKDPVVTFTGGLSILALLFILFVVVGASNAVNLTDGLDGLAAGCLIMVAGCLALFAFLSNHIDLAGYLNIAYIDGSGEIAIYLCAFIGSCIGFLWYNGHPAQVFMGDTGSLALGGIIGVAAVLLGRELLLGLIGGVFVIETLSVILQVLSFRYRNKKRIFLCTPIHHHFEYLGWPETKVVLRFWIVGLLLALVGLASLKLQ